MIVKFWSYDGKTLIQITYIVLVGFVQRVPHPLCSQIGGTKAAAVYKLFYYSCT